MIQSSLLCVQRQKFAQRVKDTAATQNTSTSVGKLIICYDIFNLQKSAFVSHGLCCVSIKTPCSSTTVIVIYSLTFCL